MGGTQPAAALGTHHKEKKCPSAGEENFPIRKANLISFSSSLKQYICMYVSIVTHIAKVWTNRVRLPILLVVSLTNEGKCFFPSILVERLLSKVLLVVQSTVLY